MIGKFDVIICCAYKNTSMPLMGKIRDNYVRYT